MLCGEQVRKVVPESFAERCRCVKEGSVALDGFWECITFHRTGPYNRRRKNSLHLDAIGVLSRAKKRMAWYTTVYPLLH